MKVRKLLAGFLSAAMVLGTMAFPVFAAPEPVEPVESEELLTVEANESNEISLMSVDDSWIDNAKTDWYNGTDKEFTLTTAEQLAGLAKLVIDGNNFSGITIKLGNDIDLAGKNWTPIGGNAKSFNGTFDGGGFSVNNMTAKNAYSYGNGFFHSLIGPATVKNVSFNNAKVYKTFTYSGNVYGIVSGYAYGNVTFENIHVSDSWVRGYGKVGAILGMAADWGGTTTVKDCTVSNVDVYGVYNSATFIGTSLNSVDMTGCSYSDVTWIPYWAETYYPIETTVADSGEIVNGLFWKYSIWYYAAWSDLYNVYKGSVALSDVSGLEWSEGSDADGWCVNDYASIGNTKYESLQDAIDAAENGDTITLRRNYKNATVNADKNITFKSSQYIMPNVVTPDNKYLKKINTTTYSILDSESTVIDTAKTTGAEVTLDNLKNNTAINHEPDATYKVVVSTAPAGDVAKANAFIENNNDTNTSKAIFDISVKKIDSYGVEKDLGGNEDYSVKDQQVTLTLGETPQTGSTVFIYHVDDLGNATKVDEVIADGTNKVTFTAPSFSTYAATYTATPLAETQITNNIGVKFERIADTSSYNVVLKALDSKTINRFMSADLTFAMTLKEGAVDYTITPAANINLIDNGNGRYEFNLDGLTSSGATGTEITIGTVTFDGYGKIDFEVNATVDTNIVNTATASDNIVDSYTVAGNGTTTGKLDISNKLTDETFKAPKKDLTVNVAFPNKVSNQEKAYQDMTVTISGGDLSAPITKELGNDVQGVHWNNNTYSVTEKLTLNTSYTVTVSGAGYRTARYTVTMTKDKTLNFWNNVKNNAEVVEVGSDASKAKNVTFLAGEIVKDNNINIYDLSAVVSYFGTSNEVDASSQYAKYDLNRDGKIDSKDIAYVLVSWGK